MAGTLVAALASSLPIVARVIQGAGGGIFPLAMGIVPESPVRTAGSINWVAAALMTAGSRCR